MKEIKYQIWHKPSETIQIVARIDFNNRTVDTYGISEPIYGIPFDDVDWREYIGFSDKNGQDIYTGDITFGIRRGYQVVEMYQEYNMIGYNTDWEKEEVFGNIWQNSDLLR